MVHSPVCPQVLPEVSNATEALQRMSKRRFDYLNKVIPQLQSQSEDCLFLNIYVPSKNSLPYSISSFLGVLHNYKVLHVAKMVGDVGGTFRLCQDASSIFAETLGKFPWLLLVECL